MSRPTRAAPRAAFTLIELLVVIAILAVLIAILLPALGGSRVASRQLQGLSNGRSVAQVFTLYTNDFDGRFPYGEPSPDSNLPGGTVLIFPWWPETTVIATSDPMHMSWAWPAFVRSVAPWQEHYPTWVSPGMDTALPEAPNPADFDDHEPSEIISWRYSNSFIADSKLWSDTPPDDAGLRAVGAHEVEFPSRKVLLWDTHLAYLPKEPELREGHWNAPTPMAFADGHADALNPTEAVAPAPNRLRQGPPVRLHDTPDGVRGFDY